jgi:transcriptional regulator GlxA family with amidase domain
MREKRIERAKELLKTTDESIGEIALASGYEHQGKFGSAFKDSYGVSPLEYRRLYRKTSEEL